MDEHETFAHFARLGRDERRVAMATLVATRGTTPKREGATMWVGEGGRILGSVTIGGCVDARVVEAAERALATSAPALLSMELGDEDAWELGLTCGGGVDVLVEPVALHRADDPVVAALEVVRAEVAAGRHAVTVAPLRGAVRRLVVRADGSVAGTLGDAALDAEARARALDVLRDGASRSLALRPGVDAFFGVHGVPATIIIFGASQVAMSLVELAKPLGMRTIVVDGRERYATRERFPGADELRVGMPSAIAEELSYGPSTIVVLLAHDYKYDLPILRAVLATGAGYIGLLGSRRRGRAILDMLAAEGLADAALARVHVPVGLDIGARSAGEIALSILAEATAVRARRGGGSLRDRGSEPPRAAHSSGDRAGARAGRDGEVA